jgi:hypothetical protein
MRRGFEVGQGRLVGLVGPVGLVGLVVLAGAPAARADDPARADRLTDLADARARAGDYQAAGAAFVAADAAAPLAARRCNAAVAYQRAGDGPRAAASLARCLAAPGLDDAFAAAARAALDALTATLRDGGRIAVEVTVSPATATLTVDDDGAPTAVGGGPLWLTPGPHRLHLAAAGFRDQAVAVAGARVTVALARGADPLAPAAAARRRAIAATVVTAVAGAAAFAFYVHTRGFSDDAALADTYDRWRGAVEDAHTWNRAAWVMSGVAGAGAVVATYLWYRAGHTTAPIELAPRGDGVWLSVTRGF